MSRRDRLLSLADIGERGEIRIEQSMSLHKQWVLAGVLLLWAIVGMIGRDPWKPKETEITSSLRDMIGADAVLPHLHGFPVLDTPPLYYWICEFFVMLAPDSFELHESARLTNLLVLVVAALGVGKMIDLRSHSHFAWDGILLLAGTMGLLFDFHLLNTHLLAMAGVAVQLYGLALVSRKPVNAGIAYGVGTTICFLSAGMLAVNVSVITFAVLALASRRWIAMSSATGLLVAAIVFFPSVAMWIAFLARSDESLVMQWFVQDRHNWLYGDLNPVTGVVSLLGNLLWSAWPMWPIMALGLATCGREMAASRTMQIGIAVSLGVVLSLAITPFHANSEVFLAYPPFAVMTVVALRYVKRDHLKLMDRLTLMSVSIMVVALLWLSWIARAIGWPDAVAEMFAGFRPGVEFEASWVSVAGAAALTVLWGALLAKQERGVHRPIINWTCGLIVAWLVFALLWLDYMDAGRSYRSVAHRFGEVHANLERSGGEDFCVENGNLQVSETAQIHYFTGISLLVEGSGCPYAVAKASDEGKSGWLFIGSRPNPHNENYFLLEK